MPLGPAGKASVLSFPLRIPGEECYGTILDLAVIDDVICSSYPITAPHQLTCFGDKRAREPCCLVSLC